MGVSAEERQRESCGIARGVVYRSGGEILGQFCVFVFLCCFFLEVGRGGCCAQGIVMTRFYDILFF